MIQIGINGFGRIGRNVLRAWCLDAHAWESRPITMINIGTTDPKHIPYMVKYDSIMGTYAGTVSVSENILRVDNHKITLVSELDPQKIPWKKGNVNWVVDATGLAIEKEFALKHLVAGADGVIVTAPSEGADVTIILGVNAQDFHVEKHRIVSLGSCTTNAIVPPLFVLNRACGIESVFLTTVHAYTNDQVLLDVDHGGDLRRGRAAALNIVPTTTGATKVAEEIIKTIKGKFKGISVRVPVGDVSMIDLSVLCKKELSVDVVHELFAKASLNELKTIMRISHDPLVSSDFKGDSHSSIIDATLTQAVGPLLKIFGWYDNEYGYSCRVKNFITDYVR